MSSKYAALPDLDSSQDIYETPDLVDDGSTLPTSVSAAARSVSEDNDANADADADDSVDGSGIVHEHLRPGDARGRFRHSQVDARGVDFSDRISGKRKSYRASSRRRRRRARDLYGDELWDEDYDSEELYGEETLERRLARLTREVEELRYDVTAREVEGLKNEIAVREVEANADEGSGGEVKEEEEEELKNEVAVREVEANVNEGSGGEIKEEEGGEDEEEDEEDEEEDDEEEEEGLDANRLLMLGIDDLSNALEGLQTVSPDESGAQAKLAKKLATSLSVTQNNVPNHTAEGTPDVEAPIAETTASYTITYSPAFKKSHALAKVADFDNRLTVLEKVLGMSASALANPDKALPSSAMIPTLDELSRQMSVLTNSSTSSLDAASRRVRQLTQEAEKLAEARKAAKAAVDARREANDPELLPSAPSGEGNSERDAKVNALYGTLPTIESLGPLLPAVLDRLRSLRTIHADAGRAVESLSKVERRQEEMSGEIVRWREALEKVEGVMKESEETVKVNMAQVEGWVKELEAKCKVVDDLEAVD